MIEVRAAYRHRNNDVEGFLGVGSSYLAAEQDAERQMKRKCSILGQPFDAARIVRSEAQLGRDELEMVRADWKSGVRYPTETEVA